MLLNGARGKRKYTVIFCSNIIARCKLFQLWQKKYFLNCNHKTCTHQRLYNVTLADNLLHFLHIWTISINYMFCLMDFLWNTIIPIKPIMYANTNATTFRLHFSIKFDRTRPWLLSAIPNLNEVFHLSFSNSRL